MRPVLKPALRRLWRDHETVQLGLDPRHTVVLAGRALSSGLLDLLDGTRDRQGFIAAAIGQDASRHDAERLLALLAEHGALDDASIEPQPLVGLRREERDRLAPDLASLALLHPPPGAALRMLAARRQASVAVYGASRVGAPLAGLLAAAGVGAVAVLDEALNSPRDVGIAGQLTAVAERTREQSARALIARIAPTTRTEPPGDHPTLAVLAPVGPPDQATVQGLVRDGVPHLLARVRETTGVIGPLVVPGRTSCLRCADLHRSDRDPDWPLLAAQLTTAGRSTVEACDSALSVAVAAHASLQALEFIDAAAGAPLPAAPLPATADGTLELALPDWRLRRRSWPPHPGCGCGWSATE